MFFIISQKLFLDENSKKKHNLTPKVIMIMFLFFTFWALIFCWHWVILFLAACKTLFKRDCFQNFEKLWKDIPCSLGPTGMSSQNLLWQLHSHWEQDVLLLNIGYELELQTQVITSAEPSLGNTLILFNCLHNLNHSPRALQKSTTWPPTLINFPP